MRKFKKVMRAILSIALFALAVICMDEAKDIYFYEVVGSAVKPVQIQGRNIATGWNVSYKKNKYFVTNLHVCNAISEKEEKMEVEGKLLKILYRSDEHDLCFAEPFENSFGFSSSLSLASFSHVGESVKIVGHPRGLDRTVRDGHIFAVGFSDFPWLPKPQNLVDFLHISVIGYPGNSGSPIVNRFGNVIGVCFAGSRVHHTELLAVPVEVLKEELDKLQRAQERAKLL